MGRLRNTIAAAAVGAALTAANANAAEVPATETIAPALEQNETEHARDARSERWHRCWCDAGNT
jgi:hypothetical protein